MNSRAVWVARLPVASIPEPTLDEGWRAVDPGISLLVLGARYWRSSNGLLVIATADALSDGSEWLHLSVSRQKYVPTYADLVRVKRVFVGPHREAIQKFVAESEHFNLHVNCIHLWARLDGPTSPDFRINDEFVVGGV